MTIIASKIAKKTFKVIRQSFNGSCLPTPGLLSLIHKLYSYVLQICSGVFRLKDSERSRNLFRKYFCFSSLPRQMHEIHSLRKSGCLRWMFDTKQKLWMTIIVSKIAKETLRQSFIGSCLPTPGCVLQ